MILYQFNLLDENDQWKTIRDRAVQVADLKKEHIFLLLYQVDSFYVEII
jgi:hypothetical protein